MLADQRYAKKMIYGADAVPWRERAADDDLCELPPKGTGVDRTEQEQHATELGAALQTWIERGSWGMCPCCGVLQPRPMRQGDLDRQAKPEIAKCFCKTCNGKGRLKPGEERAEGEKRRHCVPHPEDVPEKLRGLSQEAVAALCLGKETRSTTHVGKPNDYRKKVQMISFALSDLSPRKKIKRLGDVDMKRKAKEACKHLKAQ